jgi:hypothetical protein
VSLKRFVTAVVLAAAAAVLFVPGASAGDFDPPRMGCTGDDPATCPAGRVGEPYSLAVRLVGDQDTGCAVLHVTSGSLPLGLSITQQFNESNAAIISGTPTRAETSSFFLTVHYNAHTGCAKSSSDNQFIIPINPEVPRLVLQPEQTEVPISTVGAPYSLQMRSNLSDAKTWTISAGTLPPGVTINAADGLISGTPTTAGTYDFTVQAVLSPDPLKNPARSDTKALQIVVRDPLTITPPDTFPSRRVQSEVGLDLSGAFELAGGDGVYTWSPVGGSLPPGVSFSDGSLSGRPRASGRYGFSVNATDSEGRSATYAATILVAEKLAITRPTPAPAKVGRLWKLKLRTTGGVQPKKWKLTKGPLPKGVRFDKTLGLFSGKPAKAGRYRVTVELTDALGVKSTRTFLIVVTPAA